MGKKKGSKAVVLLLIIFILLFLGAVYFVYTDKQKLEEAAATISSLEQEIAQNEKYVYVAITDLKAGTPIEEGVNVTIQRNVSALPDALYISAEDMGKILTVPVEANAPIMTNMVTDEAFVDDTRDVEIAVANIMLNQEIYDYVDLRIIFPDGSDYLIAPKLKVKQIDVDNKVFYTAMDENEIISLTSATVDSFTITGAKIYIAKYIQPTLQEEAIPNYPVRPETFMLMESDPNVSHKYDLTLNMEERTALELRLAALTPEYLGSVAEGFGLVDTAHAAAFTKMQEQQLQLYENGGATTGADQGLPGFDEEEQQEQ